MKGQPADRGDEREGAVSGERQPPGGGGLGRVWFRTPESWRPEEGRCGPVLFGEVDMEEPRKEVGAGKRLDTEG